MELAQSLDLLQKQAGLYEDSNAAHLDEGMLDNASLNGLTYDESILESPPVHTRAALYILLNAMVGRMYNIYRKRLFDRFSWQVNHFLMTLPCSTILMPVIMYEPTKQPFPDAVAQTL